MGVVTPIVSRTHTTRATYAVYYWNRITPARGEASEEWSAEFNRGNWHRVETPRDRMIADCAAMKGIDLSLETGQIVSGPAVARPPAGSTPTARSAPRNIWAALTASWAPSIACG
jgi:hypothetical protein